MKSASVVSRILLCGFSWIFAVAAAYLAAEPLGLWASLPASVTRGIDITTGLVLLGTLVGHLVAATGTLPGENPSAS